MPRFPEFSQRVSRLPAPVFDKFRPKMKQLIFCFSPSRIIWMGEITGKSLRNCKIREYQ